MTVSWCRRHRWGSYGRSPNNSGSRGAVGTRSQINQDGLYTGALAGPFCYQEGKADEIRLLAAERGYDLADCNAYSDSISDLPFLEAVGHPVAVNPDRALREKAHRSGWPIVDVAPAKGYAVFGLPRRLLTLARLGAGGRV